MKKINFKVRKINVDNSDWQKGIFFAVIISVVIFTLALSYNFVRPIPKDLMSIINDEISSIDVIFNQKTLKMLKERQEPLPQEQPVVGKNPFLPF